MAEENAQAQSTIVEPEVAAPLREGEFETEIIGNNISEDDIAKATESLKQKNPDLYREIVGDDDNAESLLTPREDGKPADAKPKEDAPAKAEVKTAEEIEEEKLLSDEPPIKDDEITPPTEEGKPAEQPKGNVPYSRFAKVVGDLKNRDAELAALNAKVTALQQEKSKAQGVIDLNSLTPDLKGADGQPIFKSEGDFLNAMARANAHNQAIQALEAQQSAAIETSAKLVWNSYQSQIDAYAEVKPRIREAYDYVDKHCDRVSPLVKAALLRDPMAAPLTWALATQKGMLERLEGDPQSALLALGELRATIKAPKPKPTATATVKASPSAKAAEKPAEEVTPRVVRSQGTSSSIPRGASYRSLRIKGYTPEQIARGEYRS